MVNTPCLISNITLIETANGVTYTGSVDYEGIGVDEVQGSADFGIDERYYFCSNCMRKFDGSDTFDECKAHFGTFPLD